MAQDVFWSANESWADGRITGGGPTSELLRLHSSSYVLRVRADEMRGKRTPSNVILLLYLSSGIWSRLMRILTRQGA